MSPHMTFAQYRRMDLALFALMLAVSEALIATAAGRWFPAQPYTVSVVAALTAIVLMRWGAFAAIHAVLGGLVFCAASGGTPAQYVIYCVGNLFSLLALGIIRLVGSERIREDAFLSVAFGLCVLLLMQGGRAVVAAALGAPWGAVVGFFTTDALSGLFTFVIVWISRRLDGIFENQKSYLLRLHRAMEEEKGGF